MAQQVIKLQSDNGSKSMRVLETLTPVNATVAPAINATYIGQIYVDTTEGSPKAYLAIAVGSETPANDWKQLQFTV